MSFNSFISFVLFYYFRKFQKVHDKIVSFNTRNTVLTANSGKDIGIIIIVRRFQIFYRRHFDLVSKYNVGLKTLLLQGLSEPEFYCDLVYKFRKIIG